MPILTLNDPAFKDIGKYKIVAADRVEDYTKAGWKLIAVIVPEPLPTEPEITMHPFLGPVLYDRERRGRQNEYILGKDEASVVAEFNAKLQKAEQLMVEAGQRTETANNKLNQAAHDRLMLLNEISRCKTIAEAKAVVAEARKATKSES